MTAVNHLGFSFPLSDFRGHPWCPRRIFAGGGQSGRPRTTHCKLRRRYWIAVATLRAPKMARESLPQRFPALFCLCFLHPFGGTGCNSGSKKNNCLTSSCHPRPEDSFPCLHPLPPDIFVIKI